MDFTTKSNINQSRYTKKQEERRKIESLIQSGECSRRLPTVEQVAALFESIKGNKVANFGLKKLYGINLNVSYDLECYDIENSSKLKLHTLFSFAVYRGRYKVATALLRAGAKPFVDSCDLDCSEGSAATDSVYSQYPSSYVVWLAKYAYDRVKATCSTCVICAEERDMCIRFDDCEHEVCSKCFWKYVHKLDVLCSPPPFEGVQQGSSDSSSSSSSCSAIDNWYNHMLDNCVCCMVCGYRSIVGSRDSSSSVASRKLTMEPADCAKATLSAWQELPKTHAQLLSSGSRQKEAVGDALEILHLSEIARSSLGATQQQRSEELFKACATCHLRRIAALIEAGVSLECVDEYGMTALLLAAWLGHGEVVRLLLRAGACYDAADPLGYTALDLATLLRHDTVVELLQRACVDKEGLGNADCSAPSEGQQVSVTVYSPSSDSSSTVHSSFPHEDKGMLRLFSHEMCFDSDSTPPHSATIYALIPPLLSAKTHPSCAQFWHQSGVKGAELGAYCLDGFLSPGFLELLLGIFHQLPVAPSEKPKCASRSYFCDMAGRVTVVLESVLALLQHMYAPTSTLSAAQVVTVFPQMRFLHYSEDGSALAPHVDLPRPDIRSGAAASRGSAQTVIAKKDRLKISTHTLIVYLTDCKKSGDTVLLQSLPCCGSSSVQQSPTTVAVARVGPRRGRILLFPHNCPHEGSAVFATDPKILLRGEVHLPC